MSDEAKSPRSNGELDERELEAVSGGLETAGGGGEPPKYIYVDIRATLGMPIPPGPVDENFLVPVRVN